MEDEGYMSDELLYVLKWVAVIVITGFFAQFGKMIAQYVVRKAKEKKEKQDAVKTQGEAVGEIDPALEIEKKKLKLEKKRLKMEKKKMKDRE